MAGEFRFTIGSRLQARPQAVWQFVTTMQGVNAELWPLARMTFPEDMANINALPRGKPAFTSVILFLGVIPFDWHELTLKRVEPGKGFYEHSRSFIMRDWIHERRVEPKMTGCEIVDEVRFTPKIGLLGYLLYVPFRVVFWNRHRNLRRKFKQAGKFSV